MKKSLNAVAIVAVAASVMAPINASLAGDYGATSLNGGVRLTWQRQGVPAGTRRTGGEPFQVGYACLTLDRLNTNNLNAEIQRYAILLAPASDYFSLQPINAVRVQFDHRDSRTATAHPTEAIPEQVIWRNAQLEPSGDWFEANAPADELGQACVDGGIAGALDYLEQAHGFAINR